MMSARCAPSGAPGSSRTAWAAASHLPLALPFPIPTPASLHSHPPQPLRVPTTHHYTTQYHRTLTRAQGSSRQTTQTTTSTTTSTSSATPPGPSIALLSDRLSAVGASPHLVLCDPQLSSVLGLPPFPSSSSSPSSPPTQQPSETPSFSQLQALQEALTNLDALTDIVPRRSLGGLLERHPPLLLAPVQTWVDFLFGFGFQRLAVQDLLINSPDVLTSSSVFRAGQVFLFLKRIGLTTQQLVGPIFQWRALLAEGADFESVAAFLTAPTAPFPNPSAPSSPSTPSVYHADTLSAASTISDTTTTTTTSSPTVPEPETSSQAPAAAPTARHGLGLPPELLPRVALTYPDLLGRSVAGELGPRLAFFTSLGPEAPQQLRGVLWEEWCSWAHGLVNWGTVVGPKLAALEGLLGSQAAALALLRRVPEALKHPAESRLVPNLRLLRDTCGLEGEALTTLLRAAPALLSLPPEQLESRWTFLTEALNGSEADIVSYPQYMQTSLAQVTGPRTFYLAMRGLTSRLTLPQQLQPTASDPAPTGSSTEEGQEQAPVGTLDLRWLCEGTDDEWLRRVALEQQARASSSSSSSSAGTGSSDGAFAGVVLPGLPGRVAPGQDEAAVLALLRGDWDEVVAEWHSVLGWCCDRAFTRAGRKKHEEQLSLFYLMVQG